MKTNSSKNFILLFGVLIFVAFIRVILRTNNNIDNIIAGINIVSLWFVTYLILENAENKFSKRLQENTIIGEQTKLKKSVHFKLVMKYTKIIIFIFGVLYMILFANCIANDILGFISLFLSIEEEYIYNFIQDCFYKKK